VDTGAELARWKVNRIPESVIAFSPDSHMLAVGMSGTVRVFEVPKESEDNNARAS
jgi:hypothetical protein